MVLICLVWVVTLGRAPASIFLSVLPLWCTGALRFPLCFSSQHPAPRRLVTAPPALPFHHSALSSLAAALTFWEHAQPPRVSCLGSELLPVSVQGRSSVQHVAVGMSRSVENFNELI